MGITRTSGCKGVRCEHRDRCTALAEIVQILYSNLVAGWTPVPSSGRTLIRHRPACCVGLRALQHAIGFWYQYRWAHPARHLYSNGKDADDFLTQISVKI
ncbi:hypothetical protein AcV7_006164 [Taiwanofungus camphoratus]|nr:hypothetical protein AcV7_006164 [Antrodia cinnamomea]